MREKIFRYKIFTRVFAFTAVFFLCFSIYLFRQQTKRDYQTMNDISGSVINSVRENFTLINDTVIKMLANIQGSSVAARMIYQTETDQNRHAMDYKQLNDMLVMIPEVDSAVSYNNKSKTFEYFICDKKEMAEISDNIIYSGKSFASYAPYVSMTQDNMKRKKYLITYYAYDYLAENIMNGVIAVNLKPDFIEKAAKNIGAGNINISLCDENGKIVYSCSGARSYGESFSADFLSEAENGFNERISGERYFVSSGKLPASNYTIVCELPYSAVSGVGYKRHLRILLVLFILLLVAAAMTFMFAKLLAGYIKKPLADMIDPITGSDDNRDIFERISAILNGSEENSVQMIEMKKIMDDIKLQNDIKLVLYDKKQVLSREDYEFLEEIFGDTDIAATELLLEDAVDMQEVEKACRAVLPQDMDYRFIRLDVNKVLVIFKGCTADENKAYAEKMHTAAAEVTGQRVSAFAGREYSFKDMPELYREIELMEKCELKYGRGCVLTSRIINEGSMPAAEFEYPRAEENRLLKALADGDREGLERSFDEFLAKIIMCDVNDEKTAIMRVAFAIQSSVESGKDENMRRRTAELVKSIAETSNMTELCREFNELFCVVASGGEPEGQNVGIAARVAECIEEEYSNENLNLDMIADRLRLSPNYVGRLFRKETGKSVSAYLVEYRLKKAVEYMKESNISMKLLIDKIGFVSESNFYKQFKKYYGITPSEYRKLN